MVSVVIRNNYHQRNACCSDCGRLVLDIRLPHTAGQSTGGNHRRDITVEDHRRENTGENHIDPLKHLCTRRVVEPKWIQQSWLSEKVK